MQPPIIAYHVVFGAYGFWLPNDPRGSWSKEVWAPNLVRFGPPIPATTRRSVAGAPHDVKLRLAAKAALLYPAVRFTAAQIECSAKGIGDEVRKYDLPVYAAALMPDHVHMVFARQAQTAEAWIGYFKRAASRLLRETGLHPFIDKELADGRLPTPWAEGGWRVYLHTDEEIIRTVRYVEENPIKAGLPPQRWDFVTPYPPPDPA
jgi:REP element-mobilizing transposase RayT